MHCNGAFDNSLRELYGEAQFPLVHKHGFLEIGIEFLDCLGEIQWRNLHTCCIRFHTNAVAVQVIGGGNFPMQFNRGVVYRFAGEYERLFGRQKLLGSPHGRTKNAQPAYPSNEPD